MLYGVFYYKKVLRSIEKNDANMIIPSLMIGISLISLVTAINILVLIFNDDRFFLDAGKLVNLFNKDEIEFLANSTLFSVIILFITSYYLYKYFYNKSLWIYKKYMQKYRWAKLNAETNNLKMLSIFTVIIVFAGFLPVFIEQIVERDEVLEKIKSLILGTFLTTLIPYIHLLNKDTQD